MNKGGGFWFQFNGSFSFTYEEIERQIERLLFFKFQESCGKWNLIFEWKNHNFGESTKVLIIISKGVNPFLKLCNTTDKNDSSFLWK